MQFPNAMNEIHPAPVKIVLNTQTSLSWLFTTLTGGIVPGFVANPNLCTVKKEHKINITVTFLQAMQAETPMDIRLRMAH